MTSNIKPYPSYDEKAFSKDVIGKWCAKASTEYQSPPPASRYAREDENSLKKVSGRT